MVDRIGLVALVSVMSILLLALWIWATGGRPPKGGKSA